MYATADYGGAAYAFAGNGFMPSQHAAGSAEKTRPSGRGNNTIRAMTLKQLNDALVSSGSDATILDGKELGLVCIFGKVLDLENKELAVLVKVDDGTGRTTVNHFINNADSETDRQKRAEWRAGIYVRIVGHLGSGPGESKVIQAYDIRPVTDHNEITFHLLQAIFEHSHLIKGGPGAGTLAPPANPSVYNTAVPGTTAMGYDSLGGGFGPLHTEILSIYRSPEANMTDTGISIQSVLARMGGRVPEHQIRSIINELANDGHLYSTIDEDHHKITG